MGHAALEQLWEHLLSAFLATDPGMGPVMGNPWHAVPFWISWVWALGPTMALIYKWGCCHPEGMKKQAQGHAREWGRARSVWLRDLCQAPHSWITLASDSTDRSRRDLLLLLMASLLFSKKSEWWRWSDSSKASTEHYFAKGVRMV